MRGKDTVCTAGFENERRFGEVGGLYIDEEVFMMR